MMRRTAHTSTRLSKSTGPIAQVALLLVFLMTTSGCERNFDELRSNPNISTEVDERELFAQGQFVYHTDFETGVKLEIWMLNTWMQLQTNINGQVSASDSYFVNAGPLDSHWRTTYSSCLGNVSEAIRLSAGDPSKVNEHAIYRIYRAYIFHRLTDLWGSIPYSEALDTSNPENAPNFTPSYDEQASIYADLLIELEEAVDAFDTQQGSMGAQDWWYAGDINQWTRFANSLRLRLAIRMSGPAPEQAQAVIADLIARDAFIIDNTSNAQFPHSGAADRPFYEVDNRNQGMYHPAAFLADKLNGDEDPRISLYLKPTLNSSFGVGDPYIGIPSFLTQDVAVDNEAMAFSYVGDYALNQNLAAVTLSAAETHFLLAEAALKGLGAPGNAQTYYEQGVRLHMEQLDINPQAIDDYLASAGAYNGTLEQIITEKWKTLVYFNSIELYSEWRRTGYPVLLNADGSPVNTALIPKRLPYPASELNQNAAALMEVGIDANDTSSPVWWDVD